MSKQELSDFEPSVRGCIRRSLFRLLKASNFRADPNDIENRLVFAAIAAEKRADPNRSEGERIAYVNKAIELAARKLRTEFGRERMREEREAPSSHKVIDLAAGADGVWRMSESMDIKSFIGFLRHTGGELFVAIAEWVAAGSSVNDVAKEVDRNGIATNYCFYKHIWPLWKMLGFAFFGRERLLARYGVEKLNALMKEVRQEAR